MKEFRDRVLIPLSIPLAAAAVIVFIVLNMSRVLLALEERVNATVTTAVAIMIASAILFGAAHISAKGETRSSANLSVMATAGIVLLVAGFIGYEAIQEKQNEEIALEKAKEKSAGPVDVVIHAFDIGFKQKQVSTHSGKNTIEEVNDGATRHTLVLDGVPGFFLEVPTGGAKAAKTVDLKPGNYTYFCDVPGHRQAGMEGTLTVTEGGGGAAAGGGNTAAITAGDLFYKPKELSAPPGPVNISITSEGAIPHTLVVEEDPKFKKLEVSQKGATASGTLDAKPGTYTLYCDVPGHRAAGMEAKLKVG
jgi:plastocyanin